MEKTMKLTMKLWTVLPVAATALALGGCGGDGGSESVPTTTSGSSGSITACFTANSTVNYAVTTSNLPAGDLGANRSTVGPMTYNGQAVTGQTFFYPYGNTTYTTSTYWTVTNIGEAAIAEVAVDGTVTADSTFLPQNMSPGQAATNSSNDITTFIGFETLSLAGKTFPNTCHFEVVDPQGNQTEGWYASGYGMIKRIENGLTVQYNGDL
jgi:hypothetical protein